MTGKELEQIYNEAYKAVYWTAMSLLKNEDDAEDIVQDTFVALIESYDSIRDKNKVIPWLKKTAANKSLNRLTLNRTENMEDEFFDSVEAVPEDFLPDTLVESDEMRRIVMDIIERSLSEDIRRTLILFYFNEMSTKEIAEALNVPSGTVSRRINFAKNKIKKEVEKYEKENGTKLFGMALPFLSKLFIKEAETVRFKPIPASLMNLSASAKVAGRTASTNIAASAAEKGTGIAAGKILIGGIAGALAISGIVLGVVLLNNKEEPISEVTESGEDNIRITETVVTTVDTYATTAENVQTTETSITDTTVNNELYSLEGYGTDDLIEYLLGLGYISDGVTASEYKDRFDAVPRLMDEDTYLYSFDIPTDETNIIESVRLKKVDENSDGILVPKPYSSIVIDMYIYDEEYAKELYDKLFAELSSYDETISRIDDERDGSWTSTISYIVEVSAEDSHSLVSYEGYQADEVHYYEDVRYSLILIENEGKYLFTATLPVT